MDYNRKHNIHMLEGEVYNGYTPIEDATHAIFHLGNKEYSVGIVKGNFKWTAPSDGKYTLFIYSELSKDTIPRGVFHKGKYYKFKTLDMFMEEYHHKVEEIEEK